MFCGTCGAAIPDGSQFCNNCGATASGQPGTVLASVALGADPAGPAGTSGKAVGSLISALFGLILFPAAIVAIILGHISRSEIRKSNGRLRGGGMALVGLILGYAGIAVIPIVLIVAAIAIPNLLRARMAANEASAVASLRTIVTAEVSYRTMFPTAGYTCELYNLGGTEGRSHTPEHAGLIHGKLVSGEQNGYRFELRNCENSETQNKYQVVAYPLVRNQSGIKAFCADESAVIKSDPAGSPDSCLANGAPLDQ
jgi:type IV pilus assembly protein PilA